MSIYAIVGRLACLDYWLWPYEPPLAPSDALLGYLVMLCYVMNVTYISRLIRPSRSKDADVRCSRRSRSSQTQLGLKHLHTLRELSIIV
jgi:hypothetical protein